MCACLPSYTCLSSLSPPSLLLLGPCYSRDPAAHADLFTWNEFADLAAASLGIANRCSISLHCSLMLAMHDTCSGVSDLPVNMQHASY